VRVKGQRARNAVFLFATQDEIQRAELWKFIAKHRAVEDLVEMLSHADSRDALLEKREICRLVGVTMLPLSPARA
jgi:hypothetical protein